ncbi:hypothetical protein BDQ17DRAFT_1353139 [Cyathus striatus]|nr:hypothetical protein BDQ17DRAFT_1353139 [Cyathus striatus]
MVVLAKEWPAAFLIPRAKIYPDPIPQMRRVFCSNPNNTGLIDLSTNLQSRGTYLFSPTPRHPQSAIQDTIISVFHLCQSPT